ncbi:DNA replication protein [Aggregatibacter actinomycetemcomitans]|uniref:DNA replication protein n=1 Tax=Aggregatibacter actinomycetemcomitans TaxID=714 RepID=UPI00197B5A62|nr:DNA replication protein [Aggregatibacter actinomycetemcomitans]MBN6075771.1 DNA replication protein [Aggregatibacter actinomycetemcomitans]
MKPSELLRNTGRSIAYRPNLARLFGGVVAEIFFEQIFYWQDKADPVLGVYKTQEELEFETGLSRKEQETARKLLREKGVLIETHKRLEHRLYYKINLDVLDELLATLANDTKGLSRMSKSDIREDPKVAFVNTLDYNTRLHTNNNPLPLNGESANADDTEQSLGENKKISKAPNIDYSAIAQVYNDCVNSSGANLPRVADPNNLSDKRKRAIKKLSGVLLKRFGDGSADAFGDYFADFIATAGAFYFGENNRRWRADFEYLLRVETLDKTLERAL